jgi:VanZ family protein
VGSAHGPRFDRNFLIATAIIIAVILYGSLYPFEFNQPTSSIGAIRNLLQSWAEPPHRGDFLANILFYAPLGFFGILALARRNRVLPGVVLATVAGAVLSTSMELAQYYVAGRVSAANDVYANVIGTALGAVVGGVTYGNFRWSLLLGVTSNRAPCLLLALWLGYRLYPYVPTIDLHKYWDALKPVVLCPSLTGYDFFRYTMIWLTIATLIEALGGPKRARLLLPLFIAGVLVAKLLIIGKVLNVAEIAGAAMAFGIWLLLAVSVGARIRATVIALPFCAYVVVERLAPFHFAAYGRHFGWIPFLSFLHGSLEVNITSFLEKAFLYGSLIWLLGEVGLRLGTTTLLVASMLFATSWAEIYLPDRSAEITDALVALLIGAIIMVMEAPTGRSRASAS